MAKFDSKSFNPQAFGKYVERVPNPKKKELAKSGAIGSNEQAREALSKILAVINLILNIQHKQTASRLAYLG